MFNALRALVQRVQGRRVVGKDVQGRIFAEQEAGACAASVFAVGPPRLSGTLLAQPVCL